MPKIITFPNIHTFKFVHFMPVASKDHDMHNSTTSTSTFTDKCASVGRYSRIYKHQKKMRYWRYNISQTHE